jgi:Nucleolin binding domain
MKFEKQGKSSASFIPLTTSAGRVSKTRHSKMSGKKGSYFIDRNLVPRIQRYLQNNSNRRYIDISEMAEVLQRQYPEYGRKKKIPFRISVEKGLLTF